MSEINNLFDRGTGSLGNLVFFRRFGKTYIRTKPALLRDLKSPAQLAQRQRMQAMNRFLKAISALTRITYQLLLHAKRRLVDYSKDSSWQIRHFFSFR